MYSSSYIKDKLSFKILNPSRGIIGNKLNIIKIILYVIRYCKDSILSNFIKSIINRFPTIPAISINITSLNFKLISSYSNIPPMIDNSNFCIFYYNKDYIPPLKTKSRNDIFPPTKRNSGTKIAYEYALKKKKEIINLYKYCKQ